MRYTAQWLICVVAAASLAGGCRKQPAATTPDVVAIPAASLPADPNDPLWAGAPEHIAKLLLQDLVEPRELKATTPEVRVRAMASGSEIAIRLEWADATLNDLPGPSRFADACAVQFPAKVEPGVPAPQMGETGKTVEITYWNAAWQAVVDGRGDTIKDLYPNASIDHYPFQAASLQKDSAPQKAMEARYSPARSLGNHMGGPRTSPVQDLLAEGPGTLTAAPSTTSSGRGQRTSSGWAVVIRRKLPSGLSAQTPTQIAFAVWEGQQQEVGARKMRTAWIPLNLRTKP